MDLVVKQIMQRSIRTIAPEVTLPELEKAFLKEGVSGFPVVDKGELVGIVSRSDIVRQLFLEHHAAERTSDFYFDETGFHEVPLVTFDQIADRVGERIEKLQVKDVMSGGVIKVSPDQPLKMVAQTLADNHVHRVLVTEEGRLVGLVSSLDLVRLIANGRVKTDHRGD
jgi:CBS domain-containing protein